MHRRATFALSVTLLVAAPALASPRGPATQQERDKVVAIDKVLETTPWTDEAKAGRQWLDTFIAEVPDITVKRCLSLLGSPEERQGIPPALVEQHVYSSAAFLVQHPGVGAGATPTFLAGLEGTLTAYAAWRAHGSVDPDRSVDKDRSLDAVPRLDQLAKLQADGSLEAYVRSQGRNCR